MKAVLVFLSLVIFATSSCSSGEDLAAAEREVGKFRQIYETGAFEAIYDQGADELRKVQSKQAFVTLLEAIKRKLGDVTNTTLVNSNVNYSAGGTVVTLQYATVFEHGKGSERFVFRMAGKTALLGGYNVNSADLLIR